MPEQMTIPSVEPARLAVPPGRERAACVATPTDRGPRTLDTIYRRRAVRAYAPGPLSEATVRALLDAAVQAPTAMHLEPWAFVVIQDRAMLKRYSDRAKAMAQKAAVHPDELVAPVVPSVEHRLAALATPSMDIFHGAGTLIVICGKAMGPFVTADCWLAAENLMLAACALGLGTCCIGFAVPVLNTAEVKHELGLMREMTVVAPIIVGVPATDVAPVPRKPPEIVRWVR